MGCIASGSKKRADQPEPSVVVGSPVADVQMLLLPNESPRLAPLRSLAASACECCNLDFVERVPSANSTNAGSHEKDCRFRLVLALCDMEALATFDTGSFSIPQEVYVAESFWRPIITVVPRVAETAKQLVVWRTVHPVLFRRVFAVGSGPEAVAALSKGITEGLDELGQLEGQQSSRVLDHRFLSSRLASARVDSTASANNRGSAPRADIDSAAVVVVTGLFASPELNGRLAAISSFDTERCRYQAHLLGEDRIIAVAPDKLEALDSLRIVGIVRRPELNGCLCTPIRCVLDTGRVEVEVNGEHIAIRPENVQLDSYATPCEPRAKGRRSRNNVDMDATEALAILSEQCKEFEVSENDFWSHLELIHAPDGETSAGYLNRLQQHLRGQPNHRILKPKRGILKRISGGSMSSDAEDRPRTQGARFASAAEEARLGRAVRSIALKLKDKKLTPIERANLSLEVLRLPHIPAAAGIVASAMGHCREAFEHNGSQIDGQVLVTSLQAFRDNDAVRKAGVIALSLIASHVTSTCAVVTVPTICQCLKDFPRNSTLVQASCSCLAQLLQAESSCADDRIQHTDSVSRGVSRISLSGAEGETMLMSGAIRHAVLRSGGIQCLLRSLHHRKLDILTLTPVLMALGEMSNGARAQEEILKFDGPALILQSMRRCRKHNDVQRLGCIVLRRLAATDRETQELLVKHGAIRAASGSLAGSPQSDLIAQALGLLGNLSAKVPEHRQKILDRPRLVARAIASIRKSMMKLAAEPDKFDTDGNVHTSVALFGLPLLQNLSLTEAHRAILTQHGARELVDIGVATGIPANVLVLTERLKASLDERSSEGAGAFSGVFAVRAAASSPRAVTSKHQRKRAQHIAQSVLLRQRTGSSHKLGSASVMGRQDVNVDQVNTEQKHRRRSKPSESSITPPLNGYGHRGRSGWRVHEKDGDWLWHDARGLYFHCGKELLLRRFEDGSFLEVSAAPPARPVLLAMAASDPGALQRVVFVAWSEHSREHAEQGWNTDGSSSSTEFESDTDDDDINYSSTNSDGKSEILDSDIDDFQRDRVGQSDAFEPKNEGFSGLRKSGFAAAGLFSDIEDFVPAEEAAPSHLCLH